jgi:hypothetical protein
MTHHGESIDRTCLSRRLFVADPLEIRLDASDPQLRGLPIVSNLAAADEAAAVGGVKCSGCKLSSRQPT